MFSDTDMRVLPRSNAVFVHYRLFDVVLRYLRLFAIILIIDITQSAPLHFRNRHQFRHIRWPSRALENSII